MKLESEQGIFQTITVFEKYLREFVCYFSLVVCLFIRAMQANKELALEDTHKIGLALKKALKFGYELDDSAQNELFYEVMRLLRAISKHAGA